MLALFLLFVGTLVLCQGTASAPRMSDETMYQEIQHFLEMSTHATDGQTTAVRTAILDSQLYHNLATQFGKK
jgi:hypothetical protein